MQKPKSRKRILAVDFGQKRIGLAISDEQKIIASPLPNLAASYDHHKTCAHLLELIEKLKAEKGYEVEEIVVGMPLKMNGSDSTITAATRSFIETLKEKINIPVMVLDERLTSVQAERSLMDANFSRKKRAELVDRVSAVILLQCYLDLRANA
jgi:putative holliday junction resolvase